MENDLTVYETASILETKEKHYPWSDLYVEQYQQTSGGYIDEARRLGMEVNPLKHLPDQKWHFFDVWYTPSIEDGTLSEDDSTGMRIYLAIKSPELMLWIYEAIGVDEGLVENAYQEAIKGREQGLRVETILKNMRSCVTWEAFSHALNKQLTPDIIEEEELHKIYVNRLKKFILAMRNKQIEMEK